LIVVLGLFVLFTIYAAKPGGATGFERGGPVSEVAHLWSSVLSFIALFVALVLAASIVGQEYREQTLGFLFTRPRPRSYFTWTSWGVGACELLGLVSGAVVATFGALAYESRYVYTWRLLAAILPLFVGAAAVYSMTYFLTVLVRNGEKGLSYGIGILVISFFLSMVAWQPSPWPWRLWHVRVLHFPSVLSLMSAGGDWAITPVQAFPLGRFVFYGLLALGFPVAAQLILQRREV
jgi:ABC-type transport system involved in multi-copper enzyme maturation permease subunit